MPKTAIVYLRNTGKTVIQDTTRVYMGDRFLNVESKRGVHRFSLNEVLWYSHLEDEPKVEVKIDPYVNPVQHANYVVVFDNETSVLKNRDGLSSGLPDRQILDNVMFVTKETALSLGFKVK